MRRFARRLFTLCPAVWRVPASWRRAVDPKAVFLAGALPCPVCGGLRFRPVAAAFCSGTDGRTRAKMYASCDRCDAQLWKYTAGAWQIAPAIP